MDQLPEELLCAILQHVQNTPQQRSFVACLLCCRRWYNVGLPLLCNAIALRSENLASFLYFFPSRNLTRMRFLAVSITASYDNMTLSGSAQVRRLRKFAAVLAQMVNLSTFSFTFSDPQSTNPHPCQMPRTIVTTIVDNLPTSCVNLEIDTHGLDYHTPGTPHLCDRLRHVLPRLQHLRLRLTDMCPAIFAEGFNQHVSMGDPPTFTSVVAPSLKTAVINCRTGIWSSGCCTKWPRIDAHDSLIKFLRELAVCQNFPAIERLWLLYIPRIHHVGPQYHHYKRCDIIQDQTWAIPFLPGPRACIEFAEDRDVCLARTPGGQQIVSCDSALEQFVEGKTWETTLSECRMPSAILRKCDSWCVKPLPLLPIGPFYRVGRCHCDFHALLWNEGVTGLRLMSAVLREGLTDEPPLMIVCPDGWIWEGMLLKRKFSSFLRPGP